MRSFLFAAIGIILVSPTAIADGLSLAGSLWECTRSTDQSQFVITFYPGGGVGGGELEGDEVSSGSLHQSGCTAGQVKDIGHDTARNRLPPSP
jgi:hypothetical protein